jgi:hypothetical protein
MKSTKKMTPTFTKPTMRLTSVYCEADTLTLCRARFGSIRAALNYAVNQSTKQTQHNAPIQNH